MSDIGQLRPKAFRKVCYGEKTAEKSTAKKRMCQLDGCCRYGTDTCWNGATSWLQRPPRPSRRPRPCRRRRCRDRSPARLPPGGHGLAQLQLASLSPSLDCRLEMSGLTNPCCSLRRASPYRLTKHLMPTTGRHHRRCWWMNRWMWQQYNTACSAGIAGWEKKLMGCLVAWGIRGEWGRGSLGQDGSTGMGHEGSTGAWGHGWVLTCHSDKPRQWRGRRRRKQQPHAHGAGAHCGELRDVGAPRAA